MEFTEEDWRYLHNLSSVYYRRGKYPPEITRKDFNQICAMQCIQYMHKLPEFRSVAGFIRATVWYVSANYSLSAYNVNKNNAARWNRLKFEVPMYSKGVGSEDGGGYLEVEYSTDDVYEDVENKINCEDVLEYAKKYFTPLEYNILSSIYNNKTYEQIGHEQNMSKKSVYNTWLQVKHKLGNLK